MDQNSFGEGSYICSQCGCSVGDDFFQGSSSHMSRAYMALKQWSEDLARSWFMLTGLTPVEVIVPTAELELIVTDLWANYSWGIPPANPNPRPRLQTQRRRHSANPPGLKRLGSYRYD